MRSYLSLSEVCRVVDVKPYILRYWESEMDLNPKRIGKRRYYSPGDVKTIVVLSDLLRNRGMNLNEARARITDEGLESFLPQAFRSIFEDLRAGIEVVLEDLKEIRQSLKDTSR
jgi:DNA-binding transcriptional MerR regulator